MESLIKADIFFFISSIAIVILAILISVLLFYLIKAGKNLYAISEALKENFKGSEEYVIELKERLEDNMVFRLFFPPARRKRQASAKEVVVKK
ncbi:MAG: hypothetical protein WC629_02720 [Candidatus Paceibacterota bacterium]|jgi:hypothetical protein